MRGRPSPASGRGPEATAHPDPEHRVSDADPILTVLLYSSLAALAAALGVVPQALRGRLPLSTLGWANALAAGLMMGVAYILMSDGLVEGVVQGTVGAVLGMGFVQLTHLGMGTHDLDLNRLDELDPRYRYQVMLVNALHGGYEGVAIGAAMLVSLPFGISTALALAVHNVPEAMILTAVFRERGLGHLRVAGLAVATNLTQVLLSVVTFAVVAALPGLLPWALGFAVGALFYLVLVELLFESYRQAGHTSIAVLALVAMGMVVAMVQGP